MYKDEEKEGKEMDVKIKSSYHERERLG